MEFFKCSSRSTVLAENVHCPRCDKYYNVCSVRHICNREMSCTRRDDPPETINTTIYAVPIDIEYTQQVCLDCVEAERRANAPTYNKCTKCGYLGWFKPDATTGYCPSCAVVVEVDVVPDVALPTAPQPAAPRRCQPVGKISTTVSSDGRLSSISLDSFADTTLVFTGTIMGHFINTSGYDSQYSLIKRIIEAKNDIEARYPDIIWIDIPTSLRMFLEDSAEDVGLELTF